ncbi:MAG: (2E,6E)-farnesyl diphosphate synthase [Gammaproteobacteria bacterium]|nr:(2E,6E)-farnesyl diphosphate synthase [Gammaproteobacteria bacterium]
MSTDDFKTTLAAYKDRVESAMEHFLPPASQQPQRLHEAMRYSSQNGGKRVRPVLVYAAGSALGADLAQLDAPACAIEFIHAYSLVHDDLPAMDNDDLRRGKPTCHKAFDEATAILVGDALQTLAFDVLANDERVGDAATRLKLIAELANASGSVGMCGGQAIDLGSVGQKLTQAELENMHLHKTGALIRASVLMGAYVAKADAAVIDNLKTYARCVGLAFQVRDDILDVEADTETLGKTQGADIALNKPTYPALLGLDGAKKIALELHQQALDALSGLDRRADTLRAISAYIVQRGH